MILTKTKALSILLVFIMAFSMLQFNVHAETADSLSIILCGTIQGALGGTDWNPLDLSANMESIGNGIYEFVGIFPKGTWEYKIVVGESWNENYGMNGVPNGDNIRLDVPDNNYQVRLVFDYKTKIIKDSITGGIKAYRTPKEIRIIGLWLNNDTVMKCGENDIYTLTIKVPKGNYRYQVQYDNSEDFVYGAKGVRQGIGNELNLDSDTEVTFVHNLATNVCYDSINYIPIAESETPTIVSEGLKPVIMQDDDKDNIYIGQVTLPAGKKDYVFSIKMGDKAICTQTIHFNEIVDNYVVKFEYNHKTKTIYNDYIEKLDKLDGNVVSQSLYFNSRDLNYKKPFGAVPQGTEVTYTLSAKANDLERARIVVAIKQITGNQDSEAYVQVQKYPMKKTGVSEDGSREFWTTSLKFNNINVYAYYFEAVDGKSTVIYANNTQVIPIPHMRASGTGGIGQTYSVDDDKLIRYTQTVYDPDYKTPDWAKDVIYYQIFPERFKNGDKSNDPKVGITKFYGSSDIEVHSNWTDKKPWFPGDLDGNSKDDNLYCNDFYGGDLAGIMQKLDYLKELGINTIYLNPIFEAPSNHKYDTADYKIVDDNFGTNEEFKKLVEEAKKKGIRIILDTSLNHSGSDSKYMDRYGKYPDIGAFEKEIIHPYSKYYDWYEFNVGASNPDQAYNQWGNPSLANLKESDSFKNFAFRDDDSVMKFWLDMGIAGWRMDVAPWVSDEFWREWRREIKAKNLDALTVAEAWFDSSKYFLGDMFDSTMNYIFKQTIVDYANGKDAKNTANVLEMMRENYPPDAFYSLMNLLSSHDSTRALFELGFKDEGESAEAAKEAKGKLVLSVFFQMTYPGSPTIYYGDEVGVTGGEDPFNRGPYPWKEDGGSPDENLLTQFKKLIKLRNDYDVLRRGSISTIYSDENVIVMLREYKGKVAVIVTNNAKDSKKVEIDVSKLNLSTTLLDALNAGEKVTIANNKLDIEVPAYYGRVLVTQ